MKTLGLISRKKITASDISKTVMENFKSKQVKINSDGQLFIGKFPNEFYIIFDESIELKDDGFIFENELISKIPFDHAQFNHIYSTKKETAIEVATIINKVIKDLYIYDDDDGTIYPASVYLK